MYFIQNSKKQWPAVVLNSSCSEKFTFSRFYKAYCTLAWIITEKDSVTEQFLKFLRRLSLKRVPVGCIWANDQKDIVDYSKDCLIYEKHVEKIRGNTRY